MQSEDSERILQHAGLVGRNAIAMLLSGVIGFSTTIAITRILGAERYGVYAGALATAMLAGIFLNRGPMYYISREVARQPEQAGAILTDITIYTIIMALLSFVAVGIMIRFEKRAFMRTAIIVAMAPVVLRLLFRFYCSIFEGHERMFWTALLTLLMALITLGGVSLMFMRPSWRHAPFVFTVEAIAAGAVIVICLVLLWRVLALRAAAPSVGRGMAMLRAVSPFWWIAASAVIIGHCDVFFLSRLTSSRETGVYRAGINVVLLAEAVPNLMSVALLPAVARYADDPVMLRAIVWRSIKNFTVLGLGVGLCLWLLAGPVAAILYGDGYKDAAPILRLLSPVIAFRFPLYALFVVLIAKKQERLLVVAVIVAAAASMIANIVLIPRFGAQGAAMALYIALSVGILSQTAILRRRVVTLEYWRLILPCGSGIAAFLTVAWWMPGPIITDAIVGIIVYVTVMILTGGIDRRDISTVLRIFKRS